MKTTGWERFSKKENFSSKKIRDSRGNISSKNGSKDLIEYIKRWKYTEELHKKGLNDSDNHNDRSVVTYLEPDILECEVSQVDLRKHY